MADRGLALLIDYVHGHLLAASAGPEDPGMDQTFCRNVEQLARWVLAE
ncbi:hypothetical protein Rumeso_02255 [Rubellimicrobium mesophilum DSM 19309]|uniref:Transcriptional regulator, TetR family n=2 Tax=Rubellimicrobium TaxID=295418 RepID=A0A017HPE4_9RHOB|nr:hypothetical protein Rumeso_02255 [Rubellimicrobium mesophilum DSM 19309]